MAGRVARYDIKLKICPFLLSKSGHNLAFHQQALNESVGGRLLIPELTVQPCLDEGGADSAECQQSLEDLGYDPFYLQQFPGGSESTGRNFQRAKYYKMAPLTRKFSLRSGECLDVCCQFLRRRGSGRE